MSLKHIVRPIPAVFVAMSISAGALAQETKPAELPSAESLFTKCFEALNAPAALEEKISVTVNVKAPDIMGATRVTVRAMKPDKCRIDADFAEMTSAFIVINGEHVWGRGPDDDEIEFGDNEEIAAIAIMMAPQYLLHTAPDRFSAKTTGLQAVGEENSYRVELSEGEEATGTALLFSEKTGLLTGIELLLDGMPTIYHVRKWDTAEGLKVITEAVVDMSEEGLGELVFAFSDFVFNNVDATVFDMPDEVKKQIEGGGDDDDDGGGDH